MNQRNSDFCTFIISHQKPNNDTYKTLMKCGYKGPLYFVLDDKDKDIAEYQKLYGEDKVCIFSKTEMAKKFDSFDNFDFDKVIIYARNACYDIAEKLGYKYFLELDDDYDSFRFRFPHKPSLGIEKTKNIDDVMDIYLDYYKKNNFTILAWAQGADLSCIAEGKVLRKAMNALFCCTDRRVVFNGRINEDVNSYTRYNQLGHVFMTLPFIQLNQAPTQTTGGMSTTYLTYGTYTKSFYSVIQCPSFVKISTFTKGFRMSKYRIHHKINSKLGYAKILSDKYKKK